MRKLLKPNPSEEETTKALKESYFKPESIVTIVKKLDSYDDVNFLVRVVEQKEGKDEDLYLVKVHNGVESNDLVRSMEKNGGDYNKCNMESIIHYQNAIMQHLNVHGISTSKPHLCLASETNDAVPASIHTLPVVSSDHSPQKLVVRLLSWLPGRTMESVKALPIESLAYAGQFLGSLDQKLDLLDAGNFPSTKRYHIWDGKNTLDIREFSKYVTNDKRRQMVESVIDTFEKELIDSKVGNSFRKGIIQGDFNDANIIVDNDLRVSGVIDFGDSVESWKVLEISVALMYAMVGTVKSGRALSSAAAMLRGFYAVYPLTKLEREYLVLLIACRLACSASLGAFSYQQNPENEYLLMHAEPAWLALELLWGHNTERRSSIKTAVNQLFDVACDNASERNGDANIDCSDLNLPDPQIVDLLSIVRVDSKDNQEPSLKRRKITLDVSSSSGSENPIVSFVTGNKKKLEEVKRILANGAELSFTLTNKKVDLPELQGDDPAEIAKEKCALAAKEVGGAVITEDTSLCFTALNNLPGPYIKWFLDKCGNDGLNNMIDFSSDKTGYAQTIVAFCAGPEKDVIVFDGRTKGKIVPPRGALDFGWDPIFEPDEGGGLTYAEMSKEAKDSISHRSRAFSQLRDYFLQEQTNTTKSS